MPVWVYIINLIIALPEIWNTIKDIWEHIKGMPKGEEKVQAKADFKVLAKKCLADRCISPEAKKIEKGLRKGLGVPSP